MDTAATVPETPSPYDVAEFIPMIDDIIDQPLRDAVEPDVVDVGEDR